MSRMLRNAPLIGSLALAAAGVTAVSNCADKLPGILAGNPYDLDTGKDSIDLGFTMSADKDSATEGSQVTFTLVVTNHGPIPATKVYAGDLLPAGLTLTSYRAAGSTDSVFSPEDALLELLKLKLATSGSAARGWFVGGGLPVNGTDTLFLTFTVNSGTAGSVVWNVAGVLAHEPDSLLQNNYDSVSVHVRAAATGASKLAFTQQPSNVVAAATMSPAVTVAVEDAGGNTVTTANGTVSLALTAAGGATLTGGGAATVTSGVATFAGLKVDKVGTYTLTPTTTVTGVTTLPASGSFTVSAGAPTQLAFTQQPSTVVAGATISPAVTVAVEDAGGNTVTTASGTVSLALTAAGGATLTGGGAATVTGGVATFAGLKVDKVGTYTLTPTTTVTGVTTLPNSSGFTVTAPGSSDEPDTTGVTFTPIGSWNGTLDATHGFAENFDRYASPIAMTATGSCASGTAGFGLPSAQATYGTRTVTYSPLNGGCNLPDGHTPADGAYQIVSPGHGGSGQALRDHFVLDNTGSQINAYAWSAPNTQLSYSGTLIVQWWFYGSSRGPGWYNYGKWMELVYNQPTYNRIQIGVGINGSKGSHGTWAWNPGSAGEFGDQPVGPYPEDVMKDGQWHRMTIAYRPNTTGGSPSSRDGFARAWVDGTKIVDLSASAASVTPPGGTNAWCTLAGVDALGAGSTVQIIYVTWPRIQNSSDFGAYDMDFDDLKIWAIP